MIFVLMILDKWMRSEKWEVWDGKRNCISILIIKTIYKRKHKILTYNSIIYIQY